MYSPIKRRQHIFSHIALTIEALSPSGEALVVVPALEQSWKGKAIRRFEALSVKEEKINLGRGKSECSVFTVNGTPTDCVNLGYYNLCNKRNYSPLILWALPAFEWVENSEK